MISLLRTRITLVWFLLVAATALSFGMGHGIGIADRRLAGVAILIIAFVKVRFVIREFMEIRNAPLPLRLAGDGWVIAITAILIGLFLSAPL